LDLVILPLYEYGISTVAQTVVARQATLASDPDLAVRFLRASLRGWEWAVEHPTEAVDIMLALYPQMADERDFHLAAFDASIPLILPPGTRLGAIDCPAWRELDVLSNLPSTEGLCTTEVLEAAWTDMELEP
jgi:ABC-type nitrate/sulfonate/bicarbonate transport system substrate-binding protein